VRITVRPRPASAASDPSTLRVEPSRLVVKSRPLRVLDFDIENRPLSYLGSDFTTAEVTAIAWAWTDAPKDVTCYLLGESDLSDILDAFVRAYDSADMVTGHFIRGHDLPMVNGALLELGKAPLADKMTSDTKVDLLTAKGISKSQESLGAMLGLEAEKVTMNQAKWRAANRLTPAGLAEVRQRVIGDVQQHIEMRARLLAMGYLGAPKKWTSGAGKVEAYTP
jgi:hypothetical protein